MENDEMNEKVEYGKKEIKHKDENVNEVFNAPKNLDLLEKKVKIKKTEKFKKEDGIRE